MSIKTRNIPWAVPMLATLAVVAALIAYGALGANTAQAQDSQGTISPGTTVLSTPIGSMTIRVPVSGNVAYGDSVEITFPVGFTGDLTAGIEPGDVSFIGVADGVPLAVTGAVTGTDPDFIYTLTAQLPADPTVETTDDFAVDDGEYLEISISDGVNVDTPAIAGDVTIKVKIALASVLTNAVAIDVPFRVTERAEGIPGDDVCGINYYGESILSGSDAITESCETGGDSIEIVLANHIPDSAAVGGVVGYAFATDVTAHNKVDAPDVPTSVVLEDVDSVRGNTQIFTHTPRVAVDIPAARQDDQGNRQVSTQRFTVERAWKDSADRVFVLLYTDAAAEGDPGIELGQGIRLLTDARTGEDPVDVSAVIIIDFLVLDVEIEGTLTEERVDALGAPILDEDGITVARFAVEDTLVCQGATVYMAGEITDSEGAERVAEDNEMAVTTVASVAEDIFGVGDGTSEDPVEIRSPTTGIDPTYAITVEDDAALATYELLVTLTSTDAAEPAPTDFVDLTVAGLTDHYEIEGDDYIPLNGSASYEAASLDANENPACDYVPPVVYLQGMNFETGGIAVDGTDAVGQHGDPSVLDDGEFLVIAPYDAQEGETFTIVLALNDTVVARKTVTFGTPPFTAPSDVMATSNAAGMVTVSWTDGENAPGGHLVLLFTRDFTDVTDSVVPADGTNTQSFTNIAAGDYVAVVVSIKTRSEYLYDYYLVTVN